VSLHADISLEDFVLNHGRWSMKKFADLTVIYSQELTGLQCGHEFCRNCWCKYITIKIMDEGIGQVSANFSGHVSDLLSGFLQRTFSIGVLVMSIFIFLNFSC
jgi:hypothetical protein